MWLLLEVMHAGLYCILLRVPAASSHAPALACCSDWHAHATARPAEPPRAPRGTPSSQLPLHAGGYVPSGARGASAAARAADSQPRRRPGDGGGLGDWAGTGGTDDGGFSNWAGTGATSDGGGLGDWAGVGAARAAPLPARSSSYAAGEEGLAREGSWEAASVEEEELQGQVEVRPPGLLSQRATARGGWRTAEHRSCSACIELLAWQGAGGGGG